MAALILAAVLVPTMARAALGQPEASLDAEMSAGKSAVKSIQQMYYRTHEFRLPSGTVVREFAAPGAGGTIFAVAWRGPTLPDLQTLLGAHFDAYSASARAPHPMRRRVAIYSADLVIESSGRMRSFTGRAYLPRALPPGVTPEELH